jgi:hypothetical protein
MDERKIQKSFVDQVKGKKKVKKSSIGVYKYLVHHSFFEVISNAYPIFYEIIKDNNLDKEFEKSIFKFMQSKAYSPYMWKMPNEYRKFLKKSKYFKHIKYLNDLLYFEYSELFIFMQKVLKNTNHTFKMSKKYNLSKNISLHKYNYDVINKNFNEQGEYYILGYFDSSINEVVYRPLNILLFTFLITINNEESLKVQLRLFLKENQISYKEYGQEFAQVLEELYNQKVLI